MITVLIRSEHQNRPIGPALNDALIIRCPASVDIGSALDVMRPHMFLSAVEHTVVRA
jgi:hypothetical protein